MMQFFFSRPKPPWGLAYLPVGPEFVLREGPANLKFGKKTREIGIGDEGVSYTTLTAPTITLVEIPGVRVTIKKKTKQSITPHPSSCVSPLLSLPPIVPSPLTLRHL